MTESTPTEMRAVYQFTKKTESAIIATSRATIRRTIRLRVKRVEVYRNLLARTPVDELEVRERPRVIFRVSDNTWLEAIVRYLVPPRDAGSVKTRLIKKLLAALNAKPEKVMFPKGDAR